MRATRLLVDTAFTASIRRQARDQQLTELLSEPEQPETAVPMVEEITSPRATRFASDTGPGG